MMDAAKQALHDKSTRGFPLSPEERAALDAWYAQQDEEERSLLESSGKSNSIGALRARVDAASAELLSVTQRVGALTAENAKLREEIVAIQERVTRPPKAQPV
jgi:hypothetical protein